MNDNYYNLIVSFAGLLTLWAFWHYLWKPQRVDIFRQRLFAIRDELFDLAADGEISFCEPAYTRLRFLVNGMIQYAHRISLPLLLVSLTLMKEYPKSIRVDWKETLNATPEGARLKLLRIHERMDDAFAKHLIYGSIFLVGLFFVLAIAKGARFAVLVLAGKRSLRDISAAGIRRAVTRRTNTEVGVIEARMLYEEQWRNRVQPLVHAR